MKTMFISAAIFNWVAAIVLVVANDWVFTLLSLETSPTALFFLHLFCTLVFFFGIGYYRAAFDLGSQIEVIKLGAIAKASLFFVVAIDVWIGLVSWPLLLLLSVDLVYSLLFFRALSRIPKSATA